MPDRQHHCRSRRLKLAARALLASFIVGSVFSPALSAERNVARFDWFEYRGDDHLPGAGPGEYANPVLQGFYPDPSIVRIDRDYYLVNSTFAWFPGIPVFHSRDLVNWTQIGNAIDRPAQLNLDKMTMSQGLYAPDLSWHDGKFYILNTCIGCGGNFVITATNPAGPWSQPTWLSEVTGIDPSLFFDDDGSAWIVHNGPPNGKPRYEGHTAIWLNQFDAKSRNTVGAPRVLVDSGSHPERKPIWIEGPHIFKKDGLYYLIAAEGGTEEGHSEVVFRSDKVTGPYLPFAGNPILTQRDLPKNRPNPITSTGHASFVKTQRGDWWAMFLGVRPFDGQNSNTGRETFMMPVRWRDGWPRITDPGQVVPWVVPRPTTLGGYKSPWPTHGAFSIRDDFTHSKLPPYWLTLRNPRGDWWRIAGGTLGIDAKPEAFSARGNPSLLARRQQHLNATATTSVQFDPSDDGSEAGLIALQNDEYWYFLAVGRDHGKRTIRLRRRTGAQDPAIGVVLASAASPGHGAVELRIEAHGASYDFDWSPDGRSWHKLLTGADGTILSTKRAGGFTGSVFGLYAHDERKHP